MSTFIVKYVKGLRSFVVVQMSPLLKGHIIPHSHTVLWNGTAIMVNGVKVNIHPSLVPRGRRETDMWLQLKYRPPYQSAHCCLSLINASSISTAGTFILGERTSGMAN